MSFKKDHAEEKATQYVEMALKKMQTNPVFTAGYPLAVSAMALVGTLLTLTNSTLFKDYSSEVVGSLWVIVTVGDTKFLQPDSSEMMWRAFHKYKLESIAGFEEFLKSVNITESGQHVNIVYQYILQTVLSLIVIDRNSHDKPKETLTEEDVPISKEEEQVLRYVAGYIPFSLHQKYKKQTNKTAIYFCEIMRKWRACNTDTEKTFLEYTNDWIRRQNRGGLFHVGDDVYIFFRTLEHVSRQFLTKNNLNNFLGVDIKATLKEKILSLKRVHNYWQTLTREKITGDVSMRLLDMVINLWIKIRIKAFIKVYLDLKKASGRVSKKSEKSLRKSLPT